jgi:hypothetical protein
MITWPVRASMAMTDHVAYAVEWPARSNSSASPILLIELSLIRKGRREV